MAAPSLTREAVEQTAAFYRQAVAEGCIPVGQHIGTGKRSAASRVAELLGISASAAADRLRNLRHQGMLEGMGAGYTAPVLPSEDEDLDSVMARREAEQARQYAAREAAEWMRFSVHGDEPFALAFIGDMHADVCDIATLRGHISLIENTDRMWAVGLGDLLNEWSMKLRGQYANQTITERQAYQIAKWLLQKPIWWLCVLGNHSGARWHGEGSPLRWIETAAPVPIQEWQAKFSISCGNAVWRVWAAHNFPGNSIYNVGHGPKRRALMTGAEADIYVAGDRHTFTCQQDQHEHTGRVFWTIRARGYKPMDTFAEELGHGDAGGRRGIGQSIGAVFDPRDRSVVCFADLQKAADFLALLRGKPRIRVAAGRAS